MVEVELIFKGFYKEYKATEGTRTICFKLSDDFVIEENEYRPVINVDMYLRCFINGIEDVKYIGSDVLQTHKKSLSLVGPLRKVQLIDKFGGTIVRDILHYTGEYMVVVIDKDWKGLV